MQIWKKERKKEREKERKKEKQQKKETIKSQNVISLKCRFFVFKEIAIKFEKCLQMLKLKKGKENSRSFRVIFALKLS